MHSYQSDLSRRLGPVFAEQAVLAMQTSARNPPAQVPAPAAVPTSAAAYKPTHGGYPSAGARA